MILDQVEIKLAVLSGRHDINNLRECIKDFIIHLSSAAECGVLADFSSIKFFAGAARFFPNLASRSGPRLDRRVLSFDAGQVEYLYESCELTIRTNRSEYETVSKLVSELVTTVTARGGRIKWFCPPLAE